MKAEDRGASATPERSKGPWRLFENPHVYDLMQRLSGADRMLRILCADHLPAGCGLSVLDLGCGTGRIGELLGDARYVGIDRNAAYIERARRRLGGAARLIVGDFSEAASQIESGFDIVLAIGLLHHLSDGQVVDLFRLAAAKLAPGGSLVTIDPCFETDQNPLVRALIRMDRGKNVRARSGYEAIARTIFPDVRSFLRYDTLFYPYAHCILEAARPMVPQAA